MIRNLKKALLALPACLHENSWRRLRKVDFLIVRHDANCGYVYQGQAYSQLADSVSDLCIKNGYTFAVVATPYSALHGARAYQSPLVFNREFLFFKALEALLNPILGRGSDPWGHQYLWKKILARSRPLAVIGIQPDRALCSVAKQLNIPACDLQHGVINENHWWYGKKARYEVDPQYLPDAFLCWDDYSASTLRLWAPGKGIAVFVTGNPWFDRFMALDCNDAVVAEEGELFDARFANCRPSILVSLQWGLDLYYPDGGPNYIMCPALKEAILQSAHRFNWLVRLHPKQETGAARRHVLNYLTTMFGSAKNVEWELASRLPLPIVLAKVDMHITDMSSVVIEASWFGVRSCLLNPNLAKGRGMQKLFQEERDLGYADLVAQSTSDIMAWIGSQEIAKKIARKPYNVELTLADFLTSHIHKKSNCPPLDCQKST